MLDKNVSYDSFEFLVFDGLYENFRKLLALGIKDITLTADGISFDIKGRCFNAGLGDYIVKYSKEHYDVFTFKDFHNYFKVVSRFDPTLKALVKINKKECV